MSTAITADTTTYDLTETAIRLGLTTPDAPDRERTSATRTVRHLITTGKLAAVKFGTRVRVRADDLALFLDTNRQGAKDEPDDYGAALAEVLDHLPEHARREVLQGHVNSRVVRRALAEAGYSLSRSTFSSMVRGEAA